MTVSDRYITGYRTAVDERSLSGAADDAVSGLFAVDDRRHLEGSRTRQLDGLPSGSLQRHPTDNRYVGHVDRAVDRHAAYHRRACFPTQKE